MITKKQEYILSAAFLFIYFTVTAAHSIIELWGSPLLYILLFFISTIVSGLFHHFKGNLSIVFIVAHIGIETVQHSLHGNDYALGLILFFLFHTLMDQVFLWREIKYHYPQNHKAIFISIFLGFMSVFVTNYNAVQEGGGIHVHGGWLSAITLGGIMGCVISHILFDVIQKKHPHYPH